MKFGNWQSKNEVDARIENAAIRVSCHCKSQHAIVCVVFVSKGMGIIPQVNHAQGKRYSNGNYGKTFVVVDRIQNGTIPKETMEKPPLTSSTRFKTVVPTIFV